MELHFQHVKKIGGRPARSIELRSSGPISRFNKIGRNTVYIRQYSAVKYEDSKRKVWDTRPELLLHTGANSGKIERATVVFGNKIYHYEINPGEIRGDGYKVFSAIEAAAKGDMGPLETLAKNWRGETKITLIDRKGRGKIEMKIHAADIQDMVERFTRLKLGVSNPQDT